MKIRWLVCCLILFALWGCQAPPEPETEPATEPEGTVAVIAPTVPSGLYLPDSPLELATEGAVLTFPLDTRNATGIRFLGDDLLLFSGHLTTTLTLLTGTERYISAQLNLNCTVSPEDPAVTVTSEGMTYFDDSSQSLIFLDTALRETKRIFLPDSPAGIAPDWSRIYYCTDDALRVLDPETGIDRLLKEMAFPRQALTGIHCNGDVLECAVVFGDGTFHRLFFSADSGSLLHDASESLFLHTDGDFYFAVHYDGVYPELLSGSCHYGPSVLVTKDCNPLFEPVFGERSLVILTEDSETGTSTLDYYDLESGCHPYRITLPGTVQPVSILSDKNSNALWFLFFDAQTQSDMLCCWNLENSKTDDSVSYLQPRYTGDAPNLEGLQHCRESAAAISEKHGVRILIWTDAVSCKPSDYALIPEYQVPLIESGLKQLDSILSVYPEGFLEEAASETRSGHLTICLVRAIENLSGIDNGADAGVLQYWDDNANAYLAVSAGSHPNGMLFHELYHFIESHVLCRSTACDSWFALNPEGFHYDYSFPKSLSHRSRELIEGETRAFIDYFSMSYPREDRARILEYAMLPGQESCFASSIMQEKLRTLCLGIRDAFSAAPEEIFLWEQYLSEPIP